MFLVGVPKNTDDSRLDGMQVSTFNGKFNRYDGNQNGTNVNALLDALISNTRTNDSISEQPIVQYIQGTGSAEDVGPTQDVGTLKDIKDGIESSHRYHVYMAENDNTDLVHGIVICYDVDNTAQETAERLANQTAASSITE